MKSHSDSTGSILYNITFKVESHIVDDWLRWMIEEHIPEVLKTGCFFDYSILRLLDIDDEDGQTYAIQYRAESKADYNRYIELYSALMRKNIFDKWANQLVTFRSVMEVVK